MGLKIPCCFGTADNHFTAALQVFFNPRTLFGTQSCGVVGLSTQHEKSRAVVWYVGLEQGVVGHGFYTETSQGFRVITKKIVRLNARVFMRMRFRKPPLVALDEHHALSMHVTASHHGHRWSADAPLIDRAHAVRTRLRARRHTRLGLMTIDCAYLGPRARRIALFDEVLARTGCLLPSKKHLLRIMHARRHPTGRCRACARLVEVREGRDDLIEHDPRGWLMDDLIHQQRNSVNFAIARMQKEPARADHTIDGARFHQRAAARTRIQHAVDVGPIDPSRRQRCVPSIRPWLLLYPDHQLRKKICADAVVVRQTAAIMKRKALHRKLVLLEPPANPRRPSCIARPTTVLLRDR